MQELPILFSNFSLPHIQLAKLRSLPGVIDAKFVGLAGVIDAIQKHKQVDHVQQVEVQSLLLLSLKDR